MKKLIVILAIVLSMTFAMTACNSTPDEVSPVISGVKDSTSIQLTDTFNALEGVTATDDVDGDLTSAITVTSMPELTFTNGVCQPTMKGAYEITYTVKDKAGNVAEEYCTLTVTSKASTATDYYTFDFSDYDTADVPTFVDLVTYEEAQATIAKTDGVLRLNVTSTGNAAAGANSVTLFNDISTNVGSTYRINIYMKSSAPVWFNMIANHSAAGWNPLGNSNWNFNIPGTDVFTKYSVEFDAPAAAPADYAGETPYNEVKYFLELGNYNIADIGTNPTAFTVDILKIEFYEIVGTEYDESIKKITEFSASNADAITVDPAAINTTYENGNANYNITNFTAPNGWEMHLRVKLGVEIEKDKKYKIVYKMSADADVAAGGGICVEDIEKEWTQRATFSGPQTFTTEEKTFELTFKAEADLTAENAIITFYLKDAADGVNAATKVVLSEMEIFEVKGNKTQDKTNYHFYPTDANVLWTCWNDTDDDLGQNGLGYIYQKDGSLFYYIDTISGVDYGNKTFNTSLNFEADCLYRIEVTMKANKAATCWFILNPTVGYDPTISEVFDLTTEEQTFTFSTTSEFVVDKELQLIFSFGADYNTAGQVEGGLIIEFTSVKVIKLS